MKIKAIILAISAYFIIGCSAPPAATNNAQNTAKKTADPNRKLKIGFAMDTVKEERWQRDHDAFEAHCREIKVECVITVADNKADKQANDVDNLLTQNIDVLVIAPHDATQAASMVDKAKAQGVPVISYDRLINSDKIDVYISHQVPIIGQKIAEYAIQKVPKGNYVIVNGASTDNNAVIMQKEYMRLLQPAVDREEIKILAQDFM